MTIALAEAMSNQDNYESTTSSGRDRCKRLLALLGIAVGTMSSLATQGCESHVATRMIVVPGAGDIARHPGAAGCAESCLDRRMTNPREAAACLDACPGSWSVPGTECETAPVGSGCYVLRTETLRPSPDQIADVLVAVGEVAEAVDDMHEDDDEDDGESTYATRSGPGGGRGRHAAKPKRGSKPKADHKVKRKKQRDVRRKPRFHRE